MLLRALCQQQFGELTALRTEGACQWVMFGDGQRGSVDRHRHMAREGGQHLHEQRRQCADAEHRHACRQVARVGLAKAIEQTAQARAGMHAVWGTYGGVGAERTPERRLPARVHRIRRVVTRLPCLQQVGTIQLVVIEAIRNALGQPEARTLIVAGEVPREWGVHGVVGQIAQQPLDAPGQGITCECIDGITEWLRLVQAIGEGADEASRERQFQ